MNLIVTKAFEETTCWKCGCLYALTQHFMGQRRKDHNGFYCPNGHEGFFGAETEEERLKQQLAKEISKRASLDAENHKIKLKLDRVKKGICPECNRSFGNLREHMKHKHKGC